MPSSSSLAALAGIWLAACSGTAVAQSLSAPAQAPIGAEIPITVAGHAPRDFVTVVPVGTPAGRYLKWVYAEPKITLQVPDRAGEYELRLLAAEAPYATRAHRRLLVTAVAVSLAVAPQVPAGGTFEVRWQGPGNPGDYIGWAPAGTAPGTYKAWVYVRAGSPATIDAPDQPGDYVVRYVSGASETMLAEQPFKVGDTSARLRAPEKVGAGATFSVDWEGPGNPGDFLTIVPAGAPEATHARWEYVRASRRIDLKAPERAGRYEVRYLTGQTNRTLARAPLEVTAAVASLSGPARVTAGAEFTVAWTGPGNKGDYIAVAPPGSAEDAWASFAHVDARSPTTVRAPLKSGAFELRYVTGEQNLVLARAAVQVDPAAAKPARLSVRSDAAAGPAAQAGGLAVALVLDASGSMLQPLRKGGPRRIEVARQTLARLVGKSLPERTTFSLRVFGQQAGCSSDLVIPAQPLDRAAAARRVATVQARDGARTAIAASLAKVAEDLAAHRGPRMVVLVTDGEETCGGDPREAIAALRAGGVPVTVNIVGFAIDDAALRASFRQWAEGGGGRYFDGRDADGLGRAVDAAVQPVFEVVGGDGRVLARSAVDGPPVELPPGRYTVRAAGTERPVQLEDGAELTVRL